MASDTTRRLAEAAEAEFALRGIDGASVRRIAAAAGQRNTNAVGYHFGSKDELADTVYGLRQPMIDGRRGELLAELSSDGVLDLHGALTAVFLPFCEVLDEPWGRRHLHFSSHYANWMRTSGRDAAEARNKRVAAAPNYVAALAMVASALDHLDDSDRSMRLRLFEQLLPPTLGLLADDPASGPHSADLLVAMHAAALSAPATQRIG